MHVAVLSFQSCPWVGSTHGLGSVGSWVKKISTNSYPCYIIIRVSCDCESNAYAKLTWLTLLYYWQLSCLMLTDVLLTLLLYYWCITDSHNVTTRICLTLSSVCLKVCCLVVWSSVGLCVGLGHGSKVFTLRWVGLGRVSDLVGWVGLDKLDPRTTLVHTPGRLQKTLQRVKNWRQSWNRRFQARGKAPECPWSMVWGRTP